MYVEQFFVDGLGCASYLLGCEARGVAAVVDPDRDVQRYIDAAAARGMKITHVIETHLHADHVSGNTDLAARTGADIYLHEAAGATCAHRPLRDGDVLELGAVRMEVRATPGHTPESITLLVADSTRAPEPWMALTGDLLFVGDVGRPDLVGADAARNLAAHLHESLFDGILKLDDGVIIYPGHGAGSLCGRAIGSVRSTTLGFERRYNPALQVAEKDAFVEYMTTNLPEQPGNHQRIKAMNRRGPAPLGEVRPVALSLEDAVPYFRQGAGLLDLRPKAAYVAEHVPGSVHLEADNQISNRAGFVLPPGQPLILLLEDVSKYREVVLALSRIGYDKVVGYLEGGMATWRAARLPVTSGDIEDIAPAKLASMRNGRAANGNGHDDHKAGVQAAPFILDVREPWEFAQARVPGAVNIPLGQLSHRVAELDPETPVAVICAHGNRSQSAAALLGQKGFKKVYNVLGGTVGWQQAGLEVHYDGQPVRLR
jgi:glyoxylase-like metal-dependent hydrolase (beta-lactamase superfamily II)/rhodanese-related sulfurtransferase